MDEHLFTLLNRIHFNIDPLTPLDGWQNGPYQDGHTPDRENTTIDDPSTTKLIASILEIPRMSSISIGYLINRLVNQMEPGQAYVNIGVWQGFSFLAGLLGNETKLCIGVDNFSEFGSPRDAFLRRYEKLKTQNSQFFDKDYRDFFADCGDLKIGVYFYDGDHQYEHQLEGLLAATPYLTTGCYVIIDDTNMKGPSGASLDFFRDNFEEYQLLFEQKTAHNAHPTFWNGLLIFRKIR